MDFSPFNEEIVARAIFNCRTPIISAVGHETDTTIADFVSDLRAPTPSAAAELAVFEYQALENYLDEKRLQLKRALYQKVQLVRMKLERYRLKMNYLHPRNILQQQKQRSADAEQKLRNIMEKKMFTAKQEMAIRMERMKAVSPIMKLNQGFSYVASEAGTVVKSVENLKKEDRLTIYMTDGIVKAKVEDTMKEDYCGRTNVGSGI